MALSDLASLNARILSAQTFQTDEGTAVSQFNATTEGATPPADTTDEFRGFSTTSKLDFEQVVNWIIANSFGGSATGKTTAIDAFVNDWGIQWRTDLGLSPTDELDRTPTLNDLLNNEAFVSGALWLPLTSQTAVPPVFLTDTTSPDGTPVPAVGVSSVMEGIRFIEYSPDPNQFRENLKQNPSALREIIRLGGTDAVTRSISGAPATPVVNASTGFVTGNTPQVVTPEVNPSTGFVTGVTSVIPPTIDIPSIPQSSLIEALGNVVSGGGSIGGGGGGRRDLVVDENQLRAETSDLWSSWLREAPNDAKVNTIVDDYVREASSFWRDKGGQLDFQTYVENKLKSEPRYQLLYRNKPPEMSELQYQSTFSNPISGLGLRPDLASTETTRSILSGGSPAGQAQRVAGTREATQGGLTLSQKFARTLSGLGF